MKEKTCFRCGAELPVDESKQYLLKCQQPNLSSFAQKTFDDIMKNHFGEPFCKGHADYFESKGLEVVTVAWVRERRQMKHLASKGDSVEVKTGTTPAKTETAPSAKPAVKPKYVHRQLTQSIGAAQHLKSKKAKEDAAHKAQIAQDKADKKAKQQETAAKLIGMAAKPISEGVE